MRASHFTVLQRGKQILLRYKPFPASDNKLYWLDHTPDGWRLIRQYGSKPADWPKTCAAIAAAIRAGAIPVKRVG